MKDLVEDVIEKGMGILFSALGPIKAIKFSYRKEVRQKPSTYEMYTPHRWRWDLPIKLRYRGSTSYTIKRICGWCSSIVEQ